MTNKKNFNWPWPNMTPEALLENARTAAKRAYSPYSRFDVGAALLMADGSIALGSNIENASYSLTLCAERSAVAGMVSMGSLNPVAIAIAGGSSDSPCPPCGACRQVLAEFNPDMLVVLESPNRVIVINLNELLPLSFSLTGKK